MYKRYCDAIRMQEEEEEEGEEEEEVYPRTRPIPRTIKRASAISTNEREFNERTRSSSRMLCDNISLITRRKDHWIAK